MRCEYHSLLPRNSGTVLQKGGKIESSPHPELVTRRKYSKRSEKELMDQSSLRF